MTLDEMLALLPDNTTGQISAADLREVVTGLFEYITAVHEIINEVVVTGLPAAQNAIGDLDARVTALETAG